MSGYAIMIFLEKVFELFANSADPDQTPRSAASDLGSALFAKYPFRSFRSFQATMGQESQESRKTKGLCE